MISAALMALSGALIAHFLGAISPKKFYFTDTFLLLAMLIVGGMSTVTGAVTGAVAITLVTEVLRRFEGGFSRLIACQRLLMRVSCEETPQDERNLRIEPI